MARVQLIIPDEDRAKFGEQARREGMTLSAWLRAAARDRLEKGRRSGIFESDETLEAFFRRCDSHADLYREPDWEETRKLIAEARPSVADAL